ncbi:MAG: DMT family transporter [Candidatus Competibacteraceae bacterium]|nr:DMT family transporter [Candidatus Competibacteraceae bacterium]
MSTQQTSAELLRGVFLLLAGLFLLAGMDAATKILTVHYEAPLVVAMRYIVHCLLMIVFLAPTQGRKLIQTRRTGLVLIRAAALAVTSIFIGLALHRMPVAETTSITFLAPLLVVLLARPILGEHIGILRWAAAITGFCGVLLIVRPGSGLDPGGMVFALCAVGGLVVYFLLSRALAHTEQTLSLLFYTALVGAIGCGAFLPWSWGGPVPTRWELLLFLLIGTASALGHFLLTAAYRHAPASLLAPMSYLQLLWAGLLGWLVFGHVPDHLSVLGMVVITVSGGISALKLHHPKSKH